MERNYIDELIKIIQSNASPEEKRSLLDHYHENDIAEVVHDLSKEDRIQLYRILGDERLSEIFSYLDNVEDYIEELSLEKAADIIELMDTDDAIDVLDELDENDRDEIIKRMDQDMVHEISLINSYDDDQIGSQVTTNFITIQKEFTIKQAMKAVINSAAENDNVATIYVLNQDESFYGIIELRDLIIARENDDINKIIKTSYPYLPATELIENCINELKEYALDSMPVLDEKHRIIGVITLDDIIETVDDELSDDYAKLGGLSSEEDLSENVFCSVKKRMPWLLALLVLGLVISMLISSFENVVRTLPMIVFFQSLILDMAGNTGTQSLAVTIRILSDEKHDKKMLTKTILKETRVGFLNGIILSSLSFVVVIAFLFITKTEIVAGDGYIFSETLKAALAVSVSLLCAMTISSLIGSLVPILLTKLKIDPAVASGPFITTINDVIAIVLYYGLAWLMFVAIF